MNLNIKGTEVPTTTARKVCLTFIWWPCSTQYYVLHTHCECGSHVLSHSRYTLYIGMDLLIIIRYKHEFMSSVCPGCWNGTVIMADSGHGH